MDKLTEMLIGMVLDAFPEIRQHPSLQRPAAVPPPLPAEPTVKAGEKTGDWPQWGYVPSAPRPAALPKAAAAAVQDGTFPAVPENGRSRLRFSENALVQGIIMAEILQPPRALRPWRRR